MSNYRQELGRWGENLAADYLLERGYSILERNVHTSYGEIDLVACQEFSQTGSGEGLTATPESVIVFVEVKTRSSSAFAHPSNVRS